MDEDRRASEAAKALGALGAAKGGAARAKRLSPDRRRDIATEAALKRWGGGDNLPQATHGSADKPLRIGNVDLLAYVLQDGTRVLSQATFLEALGRHRKANVRKEGGEERTPAILQGKSIYPFISKEIIEKSRPMRFRTQTGSLANGYRAEILPEVCEIYLKARDAGVLPKNQEHVAKQAEILIRGLANVGIIALVDEVTGYQSDRARDALARILERFVAKELRKWVKTFPADFYKELYRLRGWHYADDSSARPAVVGRLTDNLVYRRLAPGVRDELRRLTPRDEKGRLKTHLHRRLTEEIGHPRLREHLAAVIALMRASATWDGFLRSIDMALPKYGDTMQLALGDGNGGA